MQTFDAEREMRRLRTDLDRRVRAKQQQDVTVTFLNADADQDVPHTLEVEDPETITYEVVRKDRACDVYDNPSVPRRAWTKSYITLRSTVAGATVTLRLSATTTR